MKRVYIFCLAPACLLLSNMAMAQQESEAVIEDIVVTAQKREQSLQEVPIAITGIDGDELIGNGADNLADLSGIAPNVSIADLFVPNVAQFSIRGIAFGDPDANAESKTGVMVDGVPRTRTMGLLTNAFDVERIEVLRGPQGTLFGRNNLAGTVRLVTRRPGEEFGGEFRFALGNYDLRKAHLAIDTGAFAGGMFRARLSGASVDRGGFYTNSFNGNELGKRDSRGIRATLDADFGALDATLILDSEQQDSFGVPLNNFVLEPDGERLDGDPYTVRHDYDGYGESDSSGVTFLSNYETDYGLFSLIASARELDFATYADYDGRAGFRPPPPLPLHVGFVTAHEQRSAEVYFSDLHSERFDYVLGLYFVEEDHVTDILQAVLIPPFDRLVPATINRQDARSLAFYAQTDIWLTDRIAAVLGGRHTRDEKDFDSTIFFPRRTQEFARQADWSDSTWRAGFNYFAGEDLLLYANVSTGYKGGGFNSRATLPQNLGPYDPEYVTNYEAGIKGTVLEGRLRINAAAFMIEYEDVAAVVRRPGLTRSGTDSILENLGEAELSGLELEAQLAINRSLAVSLNAAWLNSEWTEFMADLNNDGVVTDNSFFDLPAAPEWSFFAAVDYRAPMNAGMLHWHLEARYKSRQAMLAQTNAAFARRAAHTLINGYVAWAPQSRRYRVSVYGRNLTDELFRGSAYLGLFPLNTFSAPRTFGVEVQFNLF